MEILLSPLAGGMDSHARIAPPNTRVPNLCRVQFRWLRVINRAVPPQLECTCSNDTRDTLTTAIIISLSSTCACAKLQRRTDLLYFWRAAHFSSRMPVNRQSDHHPSRHITLRNVPSSTKPLISKFTVSSATSITDREAGTHSALYIAISRALKNRELDA